MPGLFFKVYPNFIQREYKKILISWKNRGNQGSEISIRQKWLKMAKKKACFPIDLLVKQAKKSSGDWIRTNDLRVMSPTSCLCSTPHRHYYNSINFKKVKILYYSFMTYNKYHTKIPYPYTNFQSINQHGQETSNRAQAQIFQQRYENQK